MSFLSLFSKNVSLSTKPQNLSSMSRESNVLYNDTFTPSCENGNLPSWQTQLVQKTKNALVAGQKVRERKQLILGISSVYREENYLEKTLKSLVKESDEEERKSTVVIIYLADASTEKIKKQLDFIKNNFQKQLDSGFFQVIKSGPEIYPPMDFALTKRTYNDSMERVLWRTKQVLDFCFLFNYATELGDYYMVIEDDVIASTSYISAIRDFISTRKERRWTALQFSGFLGIGLLFHTRDLPKLTQLLIMFHQNQPVDMLMREFISLQVPEPGIVRRIPSIFQHIGIKSTLPNKLQKLTDNTFNMANRKYRNRNPEADLVTSMKVYNDFFPEYAYRPAPGYFWGIGKTNDTVDIVFPSPISIAKLVVITGLVEPNLKVKDAIKDGIVEVGDKFEKISSSNVAICDNFHKIQNFQEKVDIDLRNSTKIQCIRIRIGPAQKSWVIIREIQVFL